ncbi:hypothetical protein GGS21DRAFT_522913 [Xylaria nigripes]|nr:hypothetical protein GGS21DRAFT_522913 [Xylaria nigripes]
MPLPAFRKSAHTDELAQLASRHAETDLEPSDRETLRRATKRVANSTTIGSILGLALGVYGSIRLMRLRTDMFAAFRSAEKPIAVLFPSGRQEPIPSAQFMRPTKWGDYAAHFFFALGGTFVGGELGLLAGTYAGARALNKDPASRERIDRAYRLLRVDLLRKEAARLERGGNARVI